jgi:hypothetical protein
MGVRYGLSYPNEWRPNTRVGHGFHVYTYDHTSRRGDGVGGDFIRGRYELLLFYTPHAIHFIGGGKWKGQACVSHACPFSFINLSGLISPTLYPRHVFTSQQVTPAHMATTYTSIITYTSYGVWGLHMGITHV